MKKLILSFVCCLLLTTNISFGQTIDCDTPPANYSCGNWEEGEEDDLYYPTYSSCPITVKYLWRLCTEAPPCERKRLQVKIVTFSVDWDDANCINFLKKLFPGYGTDNFGTIDETFSKTLIMNLQEQITRIVFEDYYNGLTALEQDEIACTGVDPNCVMPAPTDCGVVSTHFSIAECFSFCNIYYKPKPHEQYGRVTFYMQKCLPSTDCCVFNKYYCVCKENGGNVVDVKIFEEDVTPSLPDCGNKTKEPIWSLYSCPDFNTLTMYWQHSYDCFAFCN